MKNTLIAMVCTFAFLASPVTACADSLYNTGPDLVGPGHVLHLVNDHRARQIGDLVAVQFDFSVTAASNASNTQGKGFTIGIPGATGNAGVFFLSNPTNASAATSSKSSKTKANTSSFSTVMMATVEGILPSGALAIRGKQNVVVDGEKRALNVQGTVRLEDIDNTDTVLSTRIADVSAQFDGDNKGDHKGLVQKVLDVLF
jgi:flagellar L-ring protein precursor FlgH